MLRTFQFVHLAVLLFVGRASAQDESADFFENKIRPVLVERCFKCHGTEAKGGLRLDSREHLLKAVVPGKPESSLLIRAIQRTDKNLQMPKGEDSLTPDQIQHFVAWIKMGAPYPSTKAPVDLTAARRFWSFQPLKNSAIPKVKQTTWPQGAIDQFILAKLEEKGMKPSPTADARTLLRRITYDLTGLPPTPEELDAFEKEYAAKPRAAYEKAVDRLLASPQYGVQWGRHWLDVARYGDTRWVGAGEDRRWPFAYTYRDWVIRALNEDMPYDRFVTLQVAADQTPGAKPADQAALGFLTVGRWFTGNLHDVIDDQIDVVTRGFLGMSAQCARCHDHKFDPISTKDYYSLYGLFAASRMPVEGSGTLAALPEVAPPPVDAATEKELARLREELDKVLNDRLTAVRNEYRAPAKIEEYLLAAESVVMKTDNDVRALAKSKGLNESILFRWVRYLQRTVKTPHPIFAPWHAFAELPEAEFAAKAAMVVEQVKSNKMLNKHVAAILTPLPPSLPQLAKRYTEIFLKFDLPDQSPDFEQESLRQVLRNNDSPVQVSLGELGQYMSKDEQSRVVQMRRALLAKLTPLSEEADQFLAYRHEAAVAVAEVTEFFDKRRTAVAAELRSPAKIADYLLSAHEAKSAGELQFKAIVKNRKLNDLLLRRWMEFLQRNDPIFDVWQAYAALPEKEFAEKAAAVTAEIRKSPSKIIAAAFAEAPKSLQEVATRYGELIAKFNSPTAASDPEQEAIRLVSVAPGSPLSFDADTVLDYFTRKDTDELRNKENKLARIYLDHPGTSPHAMSLRESPRGYAQKVFVRGNNNVLGDDAHGRFLSVLSSADRQSFHPGKGRFELAQAIVDPANPLTARVMVNRVWQWHFGSGLIRTPSDLGTRGTEPSHPELLDMLARKFVADRWSLKKLHSEILLSATYQQSSNVPHQEDPDNRLLGRMSQRRLSFEEMRDTLLSAAGKLDTTIGGRPIDLTKAGAGRRTIFGTVDRINLPGFYRYFDFPSSDAHLPERHETIVPQQALFMMNNAFVMDQASHLAQRVESITEPGERITALYRMAYGRRPSGEELALGKEFTASAPIVTDDSISDPWRYGHGRYSEKQGRVLDFESFPFFSNGQWRGGPQDSDPMLGRAGLNSRGGNAGRDSTLAVVRRWIAPRDGKLKISGVLSVQANSINPSGDGVRGRIVSSRQGQLGTRLAHGTEETTDFDAIEVKRSDTIDFVADGRGRDQQAGFTWAPVIRMEDTDMANVYRVHWDSAKDFPSKSPPSNEPRRFGVWERYAQVLLEANEFLFLD